MFHLFTDPLTYQQFFSFWAMLFMYGFCVGLLFRLCCRLFSA